MNFEVFVRELGSDAFETIGLVVELLDAFIARLEKPGKEVRLLWCAGRLRFHVLILARGHCRPEES